MSFYHIYLSHFCFRKTITYIFIHCYIHMCKIKNSLVQLSNSLFWPLVIISVIIIVITLITAFFWTYHFLSGCPCCCHLCLMTLTSARYPWPWHWPWPWMLCWLWWLTVRFGYRDNRIRIVYICREVIRSWLAFNNRNSETRFKNVK